MSVVDGWCKSVNVISLSHETLYTHTHRAIFASLWLSLYSQQLQSIHCSVLSLLSALTSVAGPGPTGIQQFFCLWKIQPQFKNTGHWNVVKTEVKQQQQIRHFFENIVLHCVWQILQLKAILWFKTHTSFGKGNLQCSPDRSRFKGAILQQWMAKGGREWRDHSQTKNSWIHHSLILLVAVAVLCWGQGGTAPPNLAQAPPANFFRVI